MKAKANQVLMQIQKNIASAAGTLKFNKNVVVVIGSTGHGKSTLVNYIAGNYLEAQLDQLTGQHTLRAIQSWDHLRIKQGSVSQTTMPNRWIDGDTNYVYWDCPGFGDTKGIAQDVSNGFYIHKVFYEAESVKVVVVVTQNALGIRSKEFVNLLKTLTGMFNDLRQLCSCLMFVVTKTTWTDPQTFKDIIAKQLIPQQEKSQGLGARQLFLLKHLASPQGKVQLFNQPLRAGPIDMAYSRKIKHTVDSLGPANKIIVKAPISQESQNIMADLAKELNQLITTEFQSFNSVVKATCRKVIDTGCTSKQVKDKLQNISSLVKSVVQSNNKQQFIENLKQLNKFIGTWLPMQLLTRILRSISLLDFINETRNQNYDIAQWGRQLSVGQQIDSAIKGPLATKEGSHLYITGVILVMNEVAKMVNALAGQTIQSVHILAFDTIYIDQDLYNPGVSTLIFAVNWRVFGDRKISLKGADGAQYVMQKAKNGFNQEANGRGRAGQNGLRGNDGKNGGSFFGKMMGKGSVTNFQKLTIDVSGGNGGRGQSGGDGFNGRDGTAGDYQQVVSMDKKCLVQEDQYNNEKQGFANILEAIKPFVTLNGKILETYRSKGQPGGQGGHAGTNGFGGWGGLPGSVNLVNIDKQPGNIVKNTGKKGLKGQAGVPGQGGRNGDDVEGKYINEKLYAQLRLRNMERDAQGGETQSLLKRGFDLITGGSDLKEDQDKSLMEFVKENWGKITNAVMSESLKFPLSASFYPSKIVMSLVSADLSSGWSNKPQFVPKGNAKKGFRTQLVRQTKKGTSKISQKAVLTIRVIQQVEYKFKQSLNTCTNKTEYRQRWFGTD